MKTYSFKPWAMWFIATFFFAFQFILRLFPGLIMPELMEKFQVGATSFGLLSAGYYLGYAGMQIPVGILLDRYGPRNVISGCVLLCALGTLSFVSSTCWEMTVLGRFLIGAGSGAGFLGAAKTVRIFFPENRFTSMIGFTFTLGLMGALYGGRPTSLLIEELGWKTVSEVLAVLCFIIAIGVFLIFPKKSSSASTEIEQKLSVVDSLKEVLKRPKILWVGLAGALMVGPLECFADVWGVSYLVNVYGFSKPDASLITSGIYFGMLFGGPILSLFAQRFNAHYILTALCGLLMAAGFSFVLVGQWMPKAALIALMGFVGILCCYQVIVFAINCSLAPPHLNGIVTSVTNCINMSAGCFLHLLMGWIMDLKWSGSLQDTVRVYDMSSYTSSIWVIPVTLCMGFMGFMLLREKVSS